MASFSDQLIRIDVDAFIHFRNDERLEPESEGQPDRHQQCDIQNPIRQQ